MSNKTRAKAEQQREYRKICTTTLNPTGWVVETYKDAPKYKYYSCITCITSMQVIQCFLSSFVYSSLYELKLPTLLKRKPAF